MVFQPKLSPIDVARARSMRADKIGLAEIARHFRVDQKTIRRAVDPNYEASTGCSDKQVHREAERNAERTRRMQGDLAFKRRALQVRKAGLSEAPHLEGRVVTSPCTHNPIFIDPRRTVYGGCALGDVL